MRAAHWRWPLLLVLLNAAVCVVIIGDEWVKRTMEGENRMLTTELGGAEATAIHARALRWYTGLFVDSGMVADSYRVLVPADSTEQQTTVPRGQVPPPPPATAGFFFKLFSSRVQVFWLLMYQALLRLSLAVSWVPVGLCLIVPSFVDGLMRRRIKQSNVEIASPDRFGFSILAMQLMIAGYLMIMFLPFPLPPIAPLALFALTALCVRTALSHLHKNV